MEKKSVTVQIRDWAKRRRAATHRIEVATMASSESQEHHPWISNAVPLLVVLLIALHVFALVTLISSSSSSSSIFFPHLNRLNLNSPLSLCFRCIGFIDWPLTISHNSSSSYNNSNSNINREQRLTDRQQQQQQQQTFSFNFIFFKQLLYEIVNCVQ